MDIKRLCRWTLIFLAFNPLLQAMSTSSSHLYFGYGSNLSYEFFKERLKDGEWVAPYQKSGVLKEPVPEDLGVYELDDYEFSYSLDVEPFGDTGTAANVAPKKGSKVYGVLYRINEAHLQELDKTEDVNEAYFRVALKVHKVAMDRLDSTSEQEEVAWVYVGNPKYITDSFNPDPAYVDLLVTSAFKRHLPQEYIDRFLQVASVAIQGSSTD